MKRYTIHTLITVLLVTLLIQSGCAAAPSLPQVGSEQQSHTISVSGSGQVSARPDVAVVTLGVQTEDKEASAALSQNNEGMRRLIDALKEAGVAAEDIQTRSIHLWPRYEDARPEGQPQVVGYTASNTVEVRIRDLDALGRLLDSAVQAGGNRIEGIRFEISDPSQMLDQAREIAWSDAEHKAAQVAGLADAALGEVVSISETSRTPGPIAREGLGGAEAAVPVEPGSQTLEVNVQVTWELVPGQQ
jgi:hypothetical protein